MMKPGMEFDIKQLWSRERPLLQAVSAALLLAVAFLLPGTTSGALLGWLAATLATGFFFSSQRLYRDAFVFGTLLHLAALSWLVETIERFGGFPYWLAVLLFVLFGAGSGLQFVLCAWVFKRLRAYHKFLVAPFALALSWAWLDVLMPKLFPWSVAHTQLPFVKFSAVAETTGVYLLNFLMLYLVASLVWHLREKTAGSRRSLLIAAAIFVACLWYGSVRERQILARIEAAPKISAALVQGNLSLHEKGNAFYFEANLNRYRELSSQALQLGAEVLFWPETVVTDWTPENIPSVHGYKFDPLPEMKVPLIYGALGYRRLPAPGPGEKAPVLQFNSAFAIDAAAIVRGVYHKRVLMPFGEYVPGADIFPALKQLSPQTGDFAVGDKLEPLALTVGSNELRAGTLICYEDLVSEMAMDATRRDANLLVNLTNDAWYGATVAPYQHNMLAAWRAIENGRYLLRVTNTGLTAVIDPLGRTVARLPIFQEGVLLSDVHLLSGTSRYVKFSRQVFRLLLHISLVLLLLRRSRQ